MADDLLDAAADRAFAKLKRAGGDPRSLEDPFRTVAIIYSAQGVIDNGGLRYFFESDWPGQPAYVVFAKAYRNIGATAHALAIEEAAKVFEFPNPEREATRRSESLSGAEGDRIDAIDRKLGEDVWALLAEYARSHKKALLPP